MLEVENVRQQQAGLQEQLKESGGRVHSMEGELLDMSHSLEAARASTKKAEEALMEETQAALAKNKNLIEEYKESRGFQLGL